MLDFKMSENLRSSKSMGLFFRNLFYLIFVFYFSSVQSSSPRNVQFFPQSIISPEQSVTESMSTNVTKYDTEYVTFLQEENHHPSSRQKRYVYLNVQSNLDVGFLCVIPITIVLPQMSNLFNKWRRRRSKRSSPQSDDEPLFEDDDPLVQKHLDKISAYFELLDVSESEILSLKIWLMLILKIFSADFRAYLPTPRNL